MSNHAHHRPRRSSQREGRRAATLAFTVLRQVHGCTCDVNTIHRDDYVRFEHDDGCPLIGRSQIVISPKGHDR